MEEKKFVLEGTDNMEEAITNAASVVADEYYRQNGMSEVASDHELDNWDTLQEEIRKGLFESLSKSINEWLRYQL